MSTKRQPTQSLAELKGCLKMSLEETPIDHSEVAKLEAEIAALESMCRKITIAKLSRPVHSGDWHDKPLRWAVNGPNTEAQHFQTKKDALAYAKIRRRVQDQLAAVRDYLAT